MSLVMNSTQEKQSEKVSEMQATSKGKSKDEMTLVMSEVNTQTSSMSDDMKKSKQSNAPSLEEIFVEVVESKGEKEQLKINRNDTQELEVEGLSHMTLHTFLLEAEKLGKNITYTRSLKVEITD